MVFVCNNCHITGRETQVAKGITLEECKSRCVDDDTCLGIDFGAERCYFNYDQNDNTEAYTGFDAWKKNAECGTLLLLNYLLIRKISILV